MAASKRILFLPEWYPNHIDPQLGVFVEKYARAVSQKHDVALVYVYPSEVLETRVDVIEHPFLQIIVTYPRQKGLWSARKAYLHHHSVAHAELNKRWGKPDAVHLHMLFRNYLAYQKEYAPLPFVVTEQWSGYLNGNYARLPFFIKNFYKKAIKRSAGVSAVSERLAKALRHYFHPSHLKVIPNVAERINNNVQKTKDHLHLVVVADLVDEIKNVSGIMKAYASASIAKPSTLHIIGDGKDRKDLETFVSSLSLEGKEITFHGRLTNEQVLVQLQNMHFLILNSFHETFSMVTAEALLSGLPVVSSRCGEPEEFLTEENAILVPVNDDSSLCTAIEKMAQTWNTYDPAALSSTVEKRFGLQAVAEQFSDFYKDAFGW